VDELRAEGITLEFLTGTFNRDDPMGELDHRRSRQSGVTGSCVL